jgi:hypothetical protein
MWRGGKAGSDEWSGTEELPGVKEIAGKEGLGFARGGVTMSRHLILSPNNRYVDIRVHKQIPLLAEENVSRASDSIYFCMCLIMNSYARQLVVWRGLLRST